jgi:hypothetical protein
MSSALKILLWGLPITDHDHAGSDLSLPAMLFVHKFGDMVCGDILCTPKNCDGVRVPMGWPTPESTRQNSVVVGLNFFIGVTDSGLNSCLEEMGIRASKPDEAEENLVVVKGAMDWLHMLKASSTSNLYSVSN